MTARLETRTLKQPAAARVTSRPERSGSAVPAPFALRCGALLIDYIVLVGIVAGSTLVARMMRGETHTPGDFIETVGIVIALVVLVVNFILVAGLTGRTVGKWATGLRIQRVNGRKLRLPRAIVRHCIGYPLSIATLGLGFLLAVFNRRGRALEDLIAGTIVVRDEPRRGSSPQR